jgi:hypothetical protein
MSGNRYLLDTNAVVALLQGNSQLLQLLQNADWVGISVISQIEFLAFSGLSQEDKLVFQQFLRRVEVVSLMSGDTVLIEQVIQLRQQYRLKLPDAIIAAMAASDQCKLGNSRSGIC